jgi:hypothetical protein
VARRLLCLLLEQLQQPLSASPRQLPRGQPPLWDTGVGLDQGFRIRVLGEWLSDRTRRFAGIVSLFLVLHVMALQHILDLAHIMVYEYIRNHYSGQQARELAKERSAGTQRHWFRFM